MNRREFLGTAAAAGALAALAPQSGQAHTRPMELRTLFFNFSNHPEVHRRNFYAVIAGKAYPLERVTSSHPVLLEAQHTNKFLRAVPPEHITHALVRVPMAADAVSLSYTVAAADPATGTWSMPHIFFNVPTNSLRYAYRQARKGLSEGEPLKLSAKRELYAIEAARTVEDLIEESALIDSNEHAAALTIVHPDVLNVDPNSAANVKTNYVDTTSSTKALGKKLYVLGPAMPAGSSSTSPGWATLNPITDPKSGDPLRFSSKAGQMSGLLQYDPDFNPDLNSFISASTNDASTGVKNDTTMGADISAGIPNAGDLTGKTWSIHDGVTSVNQGALNLTASREGDTLTLTIVKVNDDAGFILDGSASALQMNLEATNSFVRFLGIYIVFYDDNDNQIPLSQVPTGISADSGLDLKGSNAVYLGTINPQFTLFGAPILNATFNISFTWPGNAASAQVLASGLGGSGSHYDKETEIIGIIMTSLFCFIAPAILVGVAAVPGTFTGFLKTLLVADFLTLLLEEASEIWLLIDGNKANLLTIFWQAMVKNLTYRLTGFIAAAVWFFGYVNASAVSEAAELALPIAGAIIKAIAAAEVLADLARAIHDVVVSPWTYRNNLTLTQDITVALAHDPNNDEFPETATHYIPTAIFDDGMPHQLPAIPMPPPPQGQNGVTSLPKLVFKDVQVGGKVNVLVAFYSDSGWQAGQGQTGPLANVPGTFTTPPTITLTQNQVPIGPTTQYQHQSKTALDANGNRIWLKTTTGPTEKAAGLCENAPGQLCSFRKITVTQGTSSLPGNIGYAWGAYSSAVAACAGGGQGQLDQMANIGTLDPQTRYAAGACGLNPGVKLAYNLQANPAANFYLDSSSNLLRQVQLAPPQFTDPRQKLAVGMLNLDSTDLLLHPGGKVVSVNAENHKLESLRFSPVAITDDQAAAQFTAELYSGRGTRPGLMDTPTASAITRDGVVLVLESGNSRIHALDTCANPVPLFSKQSQQYFLPLTTTDSDDFEYLDMAVEYSGYIYVLVRNLDSGTYQLDIYHPSQSDTNPISTTLNVNAARLAVDLWRNVYTLNYEVLILPSGDVPGITEPSVSLWTPSAPGIGHGPKHKRAPKDALERSTFPPNPHFSAPRPLRRRDLFSSLAGFWRIS